jgi:hypothetical protein
MSQPAAAASLPRPYSGCSQRSHFQLTTGHAVVTRGGGAVGCVNRLNPKAAVYLALCLLADSIGNKT